METNKEQVAHERLCIYTAVYAVSKEGFILDRRK